MGSLSAATKQFYTKRCGLRWEPVSEHVLILSYSPCALHIQLNLTKMLLRVIIQRLMLLPDFENLIERIRELHLQFFPTIYNHFRTSGEMDLSSARPIGRDCDKLETSFGNLLH